MRAIVGDPALTVPSPTFLLQQIYEEHDGPVVHHFDLYRLSGPQDCQRLNLAESFQKAVTLVEWAEKLRELAPSSRLDLFIDSPNDLVVEAPIPSSSAGPVDAKERHNDEGDDDDDADDDLESWGLGTKRILKFTPHGQRWEGLLDEIAAAAQRLQGAGGSA